jgi:hypothetical protein
MVSRQPLKFRYETHFRGEKDISLLRQFFLETLEVSNCMWDDFVDELQALKRSGCNDIMRMTRIYEQLARIRKKSPKKDEAKHK